jgi:hypothetical protein
MPRASARCERVKSFGVRQNEVSDHPPPPSPSCICARWEVSPTVSPTPSVIHLSRPVSGDIDHPRRQPARVTRSSTPAVPKTDCGVDYFFFRRFVFLAFAFAFLFFAIAALLA